MKCSIKGCPGIYENKKILHTVRHQGQVLVVEDVPAEVCSMCGDVLFTPETVRQIEQLMQLSSQPDRVVPLLEYTSDLLPAAYTPDAVHGEQYPAFREGTSEIVYEVDPSSQSPDSTE